LELQFSLVLVLITKSIKGY